MLAVNRSAPGLRELLTPRTWQPRIGHAPRFGWLPLLLLSLLVLPTAATEPVSIEGFTSAYRDIKVGTAETSVVASWLVQEGEPVRLGQRLLRLDDSLLKANIDVARKVAHSRGELVAAQLALAYKQRQWEQTVKLHDRDHATEQELWTAENQRDEAAAKVQAIEESLQRRMLELVQVERQLARYTITAPMDGIVVERLKEVGQAVSVADPHLVRLVQVDPLRIVANGPEKFLRLIHPGMRLPITIGQQETVADVEFVSPLVDAQSMMRAIKLRLPNPDLQWSAGQAVHVVLAPIQREQDQQQMLQQTKRRFPFLER